MNILYNINIECYTEYEYVLWSVSLAWFVGATQIPDYEDNTYTVVLMKVSLLKLLVLYTIDDRHLTYFSRSVTAASLPSVSSRSREKDRSLLADTDILWLEFTTVGKTHPPVGLFTPFSGALRFSFRPRFPLVSFSPAVSHLRGPVPNNLGNSVPHAMFRTHHHQW